MDVIIYSFFILTGAAGLSYFLIRGRYARLLQEEQEKSFALRNTELQLLSEKQRLESAVKEKEAQIIEIRSHIHTEESKAGTLSSEVLTKDKQIQSLSAQLQHETKQRNELEESKAMVERQLAEFRARAAAEESKSTGLSGDLTMKQQHIAALSDELRQQTELRRQSEQYLAEEQQRTTELLARLINEEEQRKGLAAQLIEQETRLTSAHTVETKERQQHIESLQQQMEELRSSSSAQLSELESRLTSSHTQQILERQQRVDTLLRELEEQRTVNLRAEETIHELQHQTEQLQNELGSTRGANESLNSARERLSDELRKNEDDLRQRLAEMELMLTVTKQDLESTAARLQDESLVRQSTEQALQESKQRLYAHIGELEQKGREQANAIAALQTQFTQASADRDAAARSIHMIIGQLPIPAVVVDMDGTCEHCNSALEELVGYGMAELGGKHFARLFPDEERSFYQDQWHTSADRTGEFRGETRIVAATGDAILTSINFVDIRPVSDTVKYVGFILDRTVERDAKQNFASAKAREQELQELKTRFIGMVSNQLRTALVTIAANTELLERFVDKWTIERRYHAFLRINDSLRQMIDLVRDVTFTTRAASEQYTLTLGTVDLEVLFQHTARELTADLESNHRFILSERGHVTAVTADETLIKTIALQLLSNAFKYSKDSTEVHVAIERTGPSCIIKVQDQGIGIPAAEQKHLFSSFFRASNVANIYGTGLGLTIVQQCVNLHGGTVSIESELGKGTTVTVTLPLPAAA